MAAEVELAWNSPRWRVHYRISFIALSDLVEAEALLVEMEEAVKVPELDRHTKASSESPAEIAQLRRTRRIHRQQES